MMITQVSTLIIYVTDIYSMHAMYVWAQYNEHIVFIYEVSSHNLIMMSSRCNHIVFIYEVPSHNIITIHQYYF